MRSSEPPVNPLRRKGLAFAHKKFYDGFGGGAHRLVAGEMQAFQFAFNDPAGACPTCAGIAMASLRTRRLLQLTWQSQWQDERHCEQETMIVSDSGEHLHDRATRGDTLSSDERSRLEQWYAEQDQTELAALARAPEDRGISDLQAQVAAAVDQMMTVTHRIHALMQENEALRQEIGQLQAQLIQKAKAQPA